MHERSSRRQAATSIARLGARLVSLRPAACIAAVMLVAACGDERPPWSGFELFPPDAAVPELVPELLPGVLAALAAANAARGAAGAGQTTPGSTTAVGAVPVTTTQSGVSAAGIGAAEPGTETDPSQAQQAAADSGAGQAGASAASGGAGSERPRWSPGQLPTLPWAGRAAPPRGWPGLGGEGGALAGSAGAGASPGSPVADAGLPVAADGGTPPGMDEADAGPR
jgi:hypothetical protein